ncbi:AraC family transcriptional regulator [Paenibacillus hodogayensis]|uniref:AraC family transcriptional regulator n=1 Tax=Paenibacillus hodogayensis TaxID=279208 RepID=A0ABV5VPV3_9BACL
MDPAQLFNDLSEHITLRISSYNSILQPAGWIESKSHYNYDLWLIQEGRIEISAGSERQVAAAGDLVFFYPKVPYTATNGEEACRFVYLHFELGLGARQQILDAFPLCGVIPGALVREEAERLQEVAVHDERRERLTGIRLKGCLMILLARILESYRSNDYRGRFMNELARPDSARNLVNLQDVFAYIQTHLERPIRIAELAGTAGMSEKYFIRYFKLALGVTPGQYITQLRMNRARDLLAQNRYSIQQIAAMLGYPDPYTFSKAFKKHYKVAPSQFL